MAGAALFWPESAVAGAHLCRARVAVVALTCCIGWMAVRWACFGFERRSQVGCAGDWGAMRMQRVLDVHCMCMGALFGVRCMRMRVNEC